MVGDPANVILIPIASTTLSAGGETGRKFRLFLIQIAVPRIALGLSGLTKSFLIIT